MSQRTNEGDEIFYVILAIAGIIAVTLLGVSKTFGNCPASATFNARAAEGAVILTQLLMLLGFGIVGSLFSLGRVSRTVGLTRNPKLLLLGMFLFAGGALSSDYILGNFNGAATCVDGLFTFLPF
ncbi:MULTISPECIES: hypothetical protein [Halorussus]|uniref:hypothetical protein n=1 Tax=Halorussus TaxID=1070314 RepID=UPI0020A1D2CE|nr:hypothetical protein [Halorussus vallis]USZ78693.1 hypothetical protein NGM07_24595 [Halorussus vallis]